MTVTATLLRPTDRAPSARALAVSGSATVATAFGMARYGYGLLLPDLQSSLAAGTAVLGLIGTLAYVGYMASTGAVSRLVARHGPRTTVMVGGLLAVAGTVLVAAATNIEVLGLGVATAGASAALVYPPFADAVRDLPDGTRRRTLATINCGTGWGVAVAAPIAILAGDAWRVAYVGFAVCALASTALAARTLAASTGPPATATLRLRRPPGVGVMMTAAGLVGLGSAAFWTYAVDRVSHAGLDQAVGRGMLGLAGVTSLLGIAAADAIRILGPRRTFVISAGLQAAAIATIALAAGSPIAVLAAGAAFGAAYNTIVAVTTLWGTDLYANRPTAGIAAAAGANGFGLLLGPLTGGVLAGATSLTVTMLAGTVITLAAAALAVAMPASPERAAQPTS